LFVEPRRETLSHVDEEVGIYRDEVLLMLGVLADIRDDTHKIVEYLLEDDGQEEEEDS
jgi:hypothetical protein